MQINYSLMWYISAMVSTERVHCLLCSVDLPVSSMRRQLECRQDLVAVWQTGSALKPGETTVAVNALQSSRNA